MNGLPPLRLILGGSTRPEFTAPTVDHVHSSAQRVVDSARRWASTMLLPGVLESVDPADPAGRLLLELLDSVLEHEYHLEQREGPATTG